MINVPTTEIPKLLETLKNVEQGIEQDKKADHPELLVRDLNWTDEELPKLMPECILSKTIGTHLEWNFMTTCKRGDVILVRYPNSDLQTYKKRPAL